MGLNYPQFTSNPTPTEGAVPASVDTGSELESIVKNLGVDQKTMAAAITPVSGAHVGQIPSSLTRQIGPAPTSPTPPPRSKGEAIANAITSAGNAVSQVITAEKQQKQAHLTDVTTKLMQHQYMIDEATQQKEAATTMLENAAPGSPEAKAYKETIAKADEAIASNTKNRDAITAEPKLRKDLTKIFSLNHVDIEQNDPQHVKAFQDSLKNVKDWKTKREKIKEEQQAQNQAAAKRFGEAFAASQPKAPGAPNALAQQKLAQQQATQQAILKYHEAVDPAEIRSATEQYTAKFNASTELQKQENQIRNQNFQRRQSFLQRQQILGEQNVNATKRIYLESNLAFEKAKKLLLMKDTDPDTVQAAAIKDAQEWDGREQAAQSRVDAANVALASLTSKAPGDSDYDRAFAAVNQATEDLEMVQNQSDYSLNVFNLKLAGLGRSPIPGPQPPKPKPTEEPNASTTAPGTKNSFAYWLTR